MATKLRIRVGDVEVEYEGPEAFLNKKLPELIGNVAKVRGTKSEGDEGGSGMGSEGSQTLVAFLGATNSKSNQKRKFLATAQWLHGQGKKMLRTRDITAALKESQQSRLGNPSDCLNKNIADGFCQKEGQEFFVTPEGKRKLGIDAS